MTELLNLSLVACVKLAFEDLVCGFKSDIRGLLVKLDVADLVGSK